MKGQEVKHVAATFVTKKGKSIAVEGNITISVATKYEMRHWTQKAVATDGFGVSTGAGFSPPHTAEVYTTVKIRKLK